MLISIIIPTHNRRNLLNQTLSYLLKQEQKAFFRIEIIIVDDGSTDKTRELVNDYKVQTNLITYIFHSRTTLKSSCPARIRNLGIQKSSGEIVIFLDCGVLISPCFTRRVAERYLARPDQILIHYTVGLSTLPNEYNQEILTNLSPKTLFQKAQHLAQDPEWIDEREGVFDLVHDQLDHLSAPWTLAWTCAMSVPKQLLEKIGGFDETFQDWGGEDTDLGFRLYQTGASFIATRDCIALHLPHEKLSSAERLVTNRENRKKTHRKAYLFDTELYYYYSGVYYNQVLAYYKYLVLTNHTPLYSSNVLNSIKNAILKNKNLTLLIGTDSKRVVEELPTTHNFAHNISTFKNFSQWFPAREIRYLLGCDTPYPNEYFSTIILTDFIRLLPKTIQIDLFKELYRIGQDIFCLYADTYIPSSYSIDEYRWSSFSELADVLKTIQLRMLLVHQVNDISIFKVQP